eukprot:scaffold3728_cov72-Skeletonema_dohrnii-CCMP3373.AAC.2
MAADGYFIYTGGFVPFGVTRVHIIDESLTVIPAYAFDENPNIEEVECHDRVKTVEKYAFAKCPSLRRAIMPGVEVVERGAFCGSEALRFVECGKLERIGFGAFDGCKSLTCINLPSAEKVEEYAFRNCTSLRIVIMPGVEVVENDAFCHCEALTYVECGKLEIIRHHAFCCCESLESVDLPSGKTVEPFAFAGCEALINVKFGKELESIRVFQGCTSLERITIPLKDGIITQNNIFQGCKNLKRVDLAGVVHETIAALLLEEWKNDMNEEIISINQILSYTPAGSGDSFDDVGGKALAIRMWISSVLRKIIHYKAQHQRCLNEAASTLQHTLPQDIMVNNVLPFVELPSYMFEVGDHEEEDNLFIISVTFSDDEEGNDDER